MAVSATKIISVEPITISVPIGTKLNIIDLPSILYVNYNGAPFHGYITFSDEDKKKLLVLNPHSSAASTSGTTVTGMPVPINIASDGTITNIPTDTQQEILLKGGLKNAAVSHTGSGTKTISSYESLVFYISILVGGIDWKPASRFPSSIDLLDHLDGHMKEPVTSADIPAIDAYQYLISLQTRSPAEEYQLESLKQTLAKKMILARDINFLMSCVLAVENAYFGLLERLRILELRLDYIEGTWLPEVEGRVVTLEVNMKNIWDNLLQNWSYTYQGLENAREDVYWRVYHALKHYGAAPATGWAKVPMFGSGTSGGSSDAIKLSSTGGTNYTRTIANSTTGETNKNITISSINPEALGYPSMNYGAGKTYYIMNITGYTNLKAFSGGNWSGTIASTATSSGDNSVNLNEYFHNIVIKGSGTGGVIATKDHLGFYNSINESVIGKESEALFKIHGNNGSATMHLFKNNAALTSTEAINRLRLGHTGGAYGEASFVENNGSTYAFFGSYNKEADKNSAGLVCVAAGDSGDVPESVFITGDRIHFAKNSAAHKQYMNVYSGQAGDSGPYYVAINIGNGSAGVGDGFYIGKTGNNVIMEYEGVENNYCGIAFRTNGLHLYGLSEATLEEIKAYVMPDEPPEEGGNETESSDSEEAKEIGPGMIEESLDTLCDIPGAFLAERKWRITSGSGLNAPLDS